MVTMVNSYYNIVESKFINLNFFVYYYFCLNNVPIGEKQVGRVNLIV